MSFERTMSVIPAFDRRSPNPKENYGIHGAQLWFTVTRDGEGLTFSVSTKWHLPHVQEETDAKAMSGELGAHVLMFYKPQPFGVDIHKKSGDPEDCSKGEDCNITGGSCWGGGSALLGTDAFNVLVEKGSEGLFQWMEERFIMWTEK